MGTFFADVWLVCRWLCVSITAVSIVTLLLTVLYAGLRTIWSNLILPIKDRIGDWFYNITHRKSNKE